MGPHGELSISLEGREEWSWEKQEKEAGYFLRIPLFLPLVYDNISEFQGRNPTFLKEAALFVLKKHK